MHTPKLIVGLGNPGSEYANTRHNAGWLLDRLAAQCGVALRPESKFHGQIARGRLAGVEVWLLAPMQFMNRSGTSIAAVANFYKIPVADVLVLHDELDIPAGHLRIKKGGSTGGHNGLKDTQAKLGSADFWRLRIGIDHPRHSSTPAQPVVDYVLKPPKSHELLAIEDACDFAAGCVSDWLVGQHELATRQLNGYKPK